MIDLHTHTFFSDGDLSPAELITRAVNKGYKAIALTDHCDYSNYKTVIESIIKVCNEFNQSKFYDIICLPGIELTYILPEHIPKMIKNARVCGAKIVVVHGESPVEEVSVGTNHAAIIGCADILAHPGFINEEDIKLSIQNNVYLEITSRSGHSLTNGRLALLTKKYDCSNVIINTDTHTLENLITKDTAKKVLSGAGFSEEECLKIFKNSECLVNRVGAK